jgi:hypothetical protein
MQTSQQQQLLLQASSSSNLVTKQQHVIMFSFSECNGVRASKYITNCCNRILHGGAQEVQEQRGEQ